MGYDVVLTSTMSNTLYALNQIDSSTSLSSTRLATGKEVNSALDDPINYFTSQDHLNRYSDLDNRKDEMSEAMELVEAANDGIEAILDLVDEAKSLANSALTSEDVTDSDTLLEKFNDVLTQIDELASDAYYKGTNLLGGITETLTVYFDEDGGSSLTLTGTDCSSTGLGLAAQTAGDWWDTANGEPNETSINAVMDLLDDAKSSLRTDAKVLSLDLATIEIRDEFTDEMMTTLSNGSSALIAADTNAESTKLTVLQTQQELAINSLSIESTAYSNILKLF